MILDTPLLAAGLFIFLCHLESGADYNVVTCKHCGRPYKEAVAS